MPEYRIIEDDLQGPEVADLLAFHLAEMHALSPPCKVHAMPVERLRQPDVTFYSAWDGEMLAAVGALREIDVGSWSGLTRAEVEQRFPEGYARWLDGEIGHDGETREELTERVVGAVERIAAAHPENTILVVTHGGAIRALRRHAAGDPGDPIENCGTSSLELVDGVLRVRAA